MEAEIEVGMAVYAVIYSFQDAYSNDNTRHQSIRLYSTLEIATDAEAFIREKEFQINVNSQVRIQIVYLDGRGSEIYCHGC